MARARADADRAVGGDRPRRDPGALPPAGPRWAQVRPAADARGDVRVPRARDPQLQGTPAVVVPPPDEGPRRAAPARRPPPRPRVHHEGLVLVRPRRGGARAQLPAARAGLPPDLRALRARDVPRPGGVRDHGRQRLDGLPRAVCLRREHARHVRERRLRRRHRGRADGAAATDVPGAPRCPAGGRNPRSDDYRGPREAPRRRSRGDVQGDAGREAGRHARARADARRRPARGDEDAGRARLRLPRPSSCKSVERSDRAA